LLQEVIAIATEQIETVIARLAQDKAFLMKYCQDPDKALEGYLSPAEILAIKTGDGHSLIQMGAGDSWEAFTRAVCGQHAGD
jgi:hypothetical protein